jgi:hypothetical protein
MATERKKHDAVLPEVRKPAGYGTLIAVVSLGGNARELWFQHTDEPAIVRCVGIDVSTGVADKPLTIKTKGERERDA